MKKLAYYPNGAMQEDAQAPGLQDVSVSDGMNVYGGAKLGMMGKDALMDALANGGKAFRNEAGAIFPEGEIPQIPNREAALEFEKVASPSRVNYVRNNNMADFHARNSDWPRVLADKWAMLKNAAGN